MKYIAILVFLYLATASAEGGADELLDFDRRTVRLRVGQPLVMHCLGKSITVNVKEKMENGSHRLVDLDNDEGCWTEWMPNSADRVEGNFLVQVEQLPLRNFKTPVVGDLIIWVPAHQDDSVFILSREL